MVGKYNHPPSTGNIIQLTTTVSIRKIKIIEHLLNKVDAIKFRIVLTKVTNIVLVQQVA